jgi:hypothetical protein
LPGRRRSEGRVGSPADWIISCQSPSSPLRFNAPPTADGDRSDRNRTVLTPVNALSLAPLPCSYGAQKRRHLGGFSGRLAVDASQSQCCQHLFRLRLLGAFSCCRYLRLPRLQQQLGSWVKTCPGRRRSLVAKGRVGSSSYCIDSCQFPSGPSPLQRRSQRPSRPIGSIGPY